MTPPPQLQSEGRDAPRDTSYELGKLSSTVNALSDGQARIEQQVQAQALQVTTQITALSVQITALSAQVPGLIENKMKEALEPVGRRLIKLEDTMQTLNQWKAIIMFIGVAGAVIGYVISNLVAVRRFILGGT